MKGRRVKKENKKMYVCTNRNCPVVRFEDGFVSLKGSKNLIRFHFDRGGSKHLCSLSCVSVRRWSTWPGGLFPVSTGPS